MSDRNITVIDMEYVLAHGHITEKTEDVSRPGYYKYTVCGRTPRSDNRQICVVAIPDPRKPRLKIVTVMWRDES